LDSLLKAKHAEDWEQILTHEFRQIASDDVSYILAAPDGAPLEALSQRFRQRWTLLKVEFIEPLKAFQEDLNGEEGSSLRIRLWEKYKKDYEALLPPIPQKTMEVRQEPIMAEDGKEDSGPYVIEIETVDAGQDPVAHREMNEEGHGHPPGN
jgi:hypothetical protein